MEEKVVNANIEQSKKAVSVEGNVSQFEARYVDVVNIEASEEAVYINFLQKLPNNNLSNSDSINAQVISRIAMNWSHFSRVSKLFDQILNEKRSDVIENIKQNLFPE